MCGIPAVFSLEPSDRIGPFLERSLRRVVHRGPGGSGLVLADGYSIVTDSLSLRASIGRRGKDYVLQHQDYRILAKRFLDAIE